MLGLEKRFLSIIMKLNSLNYYFDWVRSVSIFFSVLIFFVFKTKSRNRPGMQNAEGGCDILFR